MPHWPHNFEGEAMTDRVKVDGEWIWIDKLPVRAVFPCRNAGGDCRHLAKTEHAEYHKCTYQPPRVPRAYWQYDIPYNEPAQWRNTKYLFGNGPFTPDAKGIECEVFEPNTAPQSPAQ